MSKRVGGRGAGKGVGGRSLRVPSAWLCFVPLMLGSISCGTNARPAPIAPANQHVLVLANPLVQKDLAIVPSVQLKVDAILSEANREAEGLLPNSRQSLIALAALVDKRDRKVLALLTPAQESRLRELSLQYGGPAELERPNVAKALALTSSQIQKLKRAGRDLMEEWVSSIPADRQGKKAHLIQWPRVKRAGMEAAAKKVLTPSQWRAWVQMQGRPLVGFP